MAEQEQGQERSLLGRAYHRAYLGQDYLATKLALVFGFGWTIWVFFIIPLIAPYFSVYVQAKVFYYASGWVQLFALPLMIYVSNKIQRATDEAAKQEEEIIEHTDTLLTTSTETAVEQRGQLLALLEKQQLIFNEAVSVAGSNHELLVASNQHSELLRQLIQANYDLTREVRLAINGRTKE